MQTRESKQEKKSRWATTTVNKNWQVTFYAPVY